MQTTLMGAMLLALISVISHQKMAKCTPFFLDGDLMIKRIFKEAGGVIRLSSDNKQYTDKIVTQDNGDSLIIIGRVVYRSG